MAIGLCNVVFFYSCIQKRLFLEKYIGHLPQYSNQDIVVLAKDNSDILNLKSFEFPYGEKIKGHKDVLAISSLVNSGDAFEVTDADPEMFVISLRKSASVKQWLDTFKFRDELYALTPMQYKHMYKKAILSKNEALKEHYSLLDLISLFSYVGIILASAILPLFLKKEMWIFLAERLSFISSITSFTTVMVLISATIPLLCFLGATFIWGPIESLGMIAFQTLTLQVITILTISLAILIAGKGEYGKSRVF
ncbi:MAG: hypothetical protein S4CHLAM20_13900 [Chlamydiia bacterium]|nr:hypothetical protein [Chlamydiia bacterium]